MCFVQLLTFFFVFFFLSNLSIKISPPIEFVKAQRITTHLHNKLTINSNIFNWFSQHPLGKMEKGEEKNGILKLHLVTKVFFKHKNTFFAAWYGF